MKKIRVALLVSFLVIVTWTLLGRISSSKEKVAISSVFKAVKNTEKEVSDKDKDGLSDEEEKKIGTNPEKADSDGDGFMDGQEVKEGYDPLKIAPYDKVTATSTHENANVNSNSNSQNSNANQNAETPILSSSTQNENQNNKTEPKENLTDTVAKKVDDLVANYSLYSTPYEEIPEDVKTRIKKDVNAFTESLLKGTGLDFAFQIEENKVAVDEKNEKDLKKYLEQVKDVFRKNGLIKDNETLENGLKGIIDQLQEMRKTDISWGKTTVWKKSVGDSLNELSLMAVHPDLKPIHMQILKITKSLDIVFSNIQEGDYFRSFLSAGRSDKIKKEIDSLSEKIKKSI